MSSDDVAPGTVVSLAIELRDAQNSLIHETDAPYVYLHGGYGGLLPALEVALEGHGPGAVVNLQLEPDEAYGDYDPALVRIESRERYGDGLETGMEVEDSFGGDEPRVYIVTDLAEGKVVLDGNHPLAGIALRFTCRVVAVRDATQEEIESGVPSHSAGDAEDDDYPLNPAFLRH